MDGIQHKLGGAQMHQVLQMHLCSILTSHRHTGEPGRQMGAQHPRTPHVHVCPSCAKHLLCFARPCGAASIPVPHSQACGVAEMSRQESTTCAGRSWRQILSDLGSCQPFQGMCSCCRVSTRASGSFAEKPELPLGTELNPRSRCQRQDWACCRTGAWPRPPPVHAAHVLTQTMGHIVAP